VQAGVVDDGVDRVPDLDRQIVDAGENKGKRLCRHRGTPERGARQRSPSAGVGHDPPGSADDPQSRVGLHGRPPVPALLRPRFHLPAASSSISIFATLKPACTT
jgi:hypothetical protein